MYNPNELVSGFSGVVGFLQSNISQIPRISAPLTTSSSGIYVQNKHPLVSLENLYYSAPDFNQNNYEAWVSGTSYVIGDTVTSASILYIAIANVPDSIVAPAGAPLSWAATNPFQIWLQQKFNQGVSNLFSEVIKKMKLTDSGKALLERQQLFRGVANRNSGIVPSGCAVGFEILPQQAEGLLVIIDQIGTQFLLEQDLTIYLYHSSHPSEPIDEITIRTAGSSNFKWDSIVGGWVMKYLSDYNTNGTYAVFWFEDDLIPGNQALGKEWSCGSPPCQGCDGQDLFMYNRWSRYTAFRNIRIPPSGINGLELPDFSQATFRSQTNWGLNFSLTVRCDLTDFILYRPFLYADVLAMQLTLECLQAIANSTRLEPALSQIKLMARAELNLNEKSTFINRYWDSIRALQIDMTGFSSSCQPCGDSKQGKAGKWRGM